MLNTFVNFENHSADHNELENELTDITKNSKYTSIYTSILGMEKSSWRFFNAI